jgi:hypothetical protein
MTDEQALRVIQALADGADPFTGEALPEGSLWHNAEVVRALFRSAELLGSAARRGRLPAKAGQPWSREESDELGRQFDQGWTIEKLAEAHGRTRGGIASRLVRIGKITERAEVLPERR